MVANGGEETTFVDVAGVGKPASLGFGFVVGCGTICAGVDVTHVSGYSVHVNAHAMKQTYGIAKTQNKRQWIKGRTKEWRKKKTQV